MPHRHPGDPPQSFVDAWGSLAEARKVWGALEADSAKRSKPKREPASVAELGRKVPACATLQLELVRCGKAKCRKWHGPYWYAYWTVKGRTRTAYVGSSERLQALYEARGLSSADASNMVTADHHVATVKQRRARRDRPRRAPPEVLDEPAPEVPANLADARERRALRAILAKPLDGLDREDLARVLVAGLVRRSTPRDGHARGRYVFTAAGLDLKGYPGKGARRG